jgi:hypothetical protein
LKHKFLVTVLNQASIFSTALRDSRFDHALINTSCVISSAISADRVNEKEKE